MLWHQPQLLRMLVPLLRQVTLSSALWWYGFRPDKVLEYLRWHARAVDVSRYIWKSIYWQGGRPYRSTVTQHGVQYGKHQWFHYVSRIALMVCRVIASKTSTAMNVLTSTFCASFTFPMVHMLTLVEMVLSALVVTSGLRRMQVVQVHSMQRTRITMAQSPSVSSTPAPAHRSLTILIVNGSIIPQYREIRERSFGWSQLSRTTSLVIYPKLKSRSRTPWLTIQVSCINQSNTNFRN